MVSQEALESDKFAIQGRFVRNAWWFCFPSSPRNHEGVKGGKYSLGPTQCWTRTALTDSGGVMPYFNNCNSFNSVLLPFATEALGFAGLFPGITNTLLTLDSNFRIPFYREYALAMGIASVSRESCENLLSKGGIDGEGMGRAVTIVIGGARESLDALPHTLRLVLKRRKGFIKLAIHTGADLVPVLAFGENDLYEQVRSENHPVIHKLQMLVKHTLGFTIPLFHARGVFNYDVGLMPYRRPLNIVVGRPIHVVQQRDREKIDDDYINHLHSLYVQELERIWEEWKDKYARDRTSEIEIVA
ncbi:hypothetical protein CBS63078_10515 [Aspergillus niger]|nr:hypothetical protein CBS115989_8204 [Aspergillus niger]KAI2816133.1 hypothetical protein CBS133816_10688 [Aspergillus niger]KAI2842007.1 hypothetical protein CBS12448_10320 [Aspergillus niger]KAI2846377.1 hypothetical protein CBS11232_7441 [Aspergillus niger]KAI2853534.1 hypothetical protein CBS11350_272 [Aspergillus niger]